VTALLKKNADSQKRISSPEKQLKEANAHIANLKQRGATAQVDQRNGRQQQQQRGYGAGQQQRTYGTGQQQTTQPPPYQQRYRAFGGNADLVDSDGGSDYQKNAFPQHGH